MWPIEFEEWMDGQKNDGHIATVSCTQSFGENEIGLILHVVKLVRFKRQFVIKY